MNEVLTEEGDTPEGYLLRKKAMCGHSKKVASASQGGLRRNQTCQHRSRTSSLWNLEKKISVVQATINHILIW